MTPFPGVAVALRRHQAGVRHTGRLIWATLCAAVLLGCAAPPAGVFRDLSAPMGQTVRYTPEDMAGTWFVLAYFGPAAQDRMTFDAARETLNGADVVYRVGPDDLAVMWVDADVRTAVVGSVDGRVGFVLDRAQQGAPDRYAAAVDVLDFYGWDTSRLERVR